MVSTNIQRAHDFLLSLGYIFTGQSCGCGGKPVTRTYKTTEKQIKIFTKNETFKINNSTVQPLEEIYTSI